MTGSLAVYLLPPTKREASVKRGGRSYQRCLDYVAQLKFGSSS